MFKSIGLVVGILLGLLLVVLFSKFANKDNAVKSKYDERQEIVRGKAYRYAFYSVMIYEALMLVLEIGQIALPLPSYILHFTGIIVGCIVLAGYCIWKDVYWGLNNNRKRYAIIFLACAALNAIPVAASIAGSDSFGEAWLNVIVLVMMAVIGIELLIKEAMDRREAE
ncbi:MAG: hypothetical protein K6B12_03410 [Clostridiales bacterium]|nr:hypothetical protein [Clostridiales bacterium]